MKLGLSSYSYWHFRDERYPIERVIEHAAELGLSGVEILHQQMAGENNACLQRLKRAAFLAGVDLHALSIHQDFVHPAEALRNLHISHTKRCIDLAHELGIPAIRINSGRWKTIPGFDELMANGGDEPALDGHTDDEAFGWVIDSIEQCLPHAELRGVVLALESHWGLTRAAAGVLRIIEAAPSPWLRVCLDTGNLLCNPSPSSPLPHGESGASPMPNYADMAALAPYACLVHAKTYFGGGEWYTLELDYARIGAMLRSAGYRGYVSLEYEGREAAATAVPKSVALLRQQLVKEL